MDAERLQLSMLLEPDGESVIHGDHGDCTARGVYGLLDTHDYRFSSHGAELGINQLLFDYQFPKAPADGLQQSKIAQDGLQ